MWRLLIGALVLTACADAPSAQPAEPAASIIDSTTDSADSPVDSPAAPSDVSASESSAGTVDPGAVVPRGVDRVAARVTEPDGSVCEVCLWLADDGDERRTGLMFATDLGAADGMAFRYPDPHTGWFWMKNTVMPLSIAFFAPDGSYVDAFDMEPCTSEPCFRYETPQRFLVAVETTLGGLADLGLVPGSTLELLDIPCPTG